ncbi:MAG: energy transducer TonB [Acidobacteriota bacterium]|jgi:protein TonB
MVRKKIPLFLVLFALCLVCDAASDSGKPPAAKPGTGASAAAAAAAPASDTKDGDFVDAELVDTPPVVQKQVIPQSTRIAIKGHVSGTVLLRVLVDANGAPEKVDVLRDTAPKVGLGDASKAALEQWRWKPATKDGHKVKTWIALQVPFKN